MDLDWSSRIQKIVKDGVPKLKQKLLTLPDVNRRCGYMSASTRIWKPWGWLRLHLIFTMRDISITSDPGLHTNLTSHGTSLKWSQRPSNHLENSDKLRNEKGNPLSSLKGSQWKLRQKQDQNFQMKGKW